MIFGVNVGFAMKRWPEPEVWSMLITDKLGVNDVQVSLDLVDLDASSAELEKQARRIRRACENAGVTISSVFSGLIDYCRNLLLDPDPRMREVALRRYQTAIELTAMLEAPAFGGHLGACSVTDYQDQTRRKHLTDVELELVGKLARHAGESGLTWLLWEPMPVAREWPSTIEECKDLASQFDQFDGAEVAYCLDVGHACRPDLDPSEQDPYRWIAELAHLSPIVHLQQTDGKGDRHWCFTDETNKVGIITPDRVFDALKKADRPATSHLILEVFPAFEAADEQVVKDLADSCRLWTAALGERNEVPQTSH